MSLLALPCLGAGAETGRRAVPFSLHRDHLILVPGRVGMLSGLVFLIDTGAGRTILDTGVGDRLGTPARPAALESFGVRVPAYEIPEQNVDLGDEPMGDRPLLVTDLGRAAASLGLARLDGIVGLDLLGTVNFTIDFGRRELSFGPPLKPAHRVGFVPHPVFLVVPANVDGRTVHLIVDSGASHIVMFDAAAAGSRPASPLESGALHGAARVRPLLLDVRIGAWRARAVAALSVERDPAGSSAAGGLLSLQALGASLVQFDLERGELGWR